VCVCVCVCVRVCVCVCVCAHVRSATESPWVTLIRIMMMSLAFSVASSVQFH